MEYYIKDILDQSEHKNVVDFLSSISFYCTEQHPDWISENALGLKKIFYCTSDLNDVQCFANIFISKNGPFKLAYISFGPAFEDYEVLIKSLNFLHNYFYEQGYVFFSVQLGIYISEKTELLEYIINKNFKLKYFINSGSTWSSMLVDLTRSETELFKSFCSAHKSNIKSANKIGLRITIQKEDHNLNAFIALFIKMCEYRKLAYRKHDLILFFTNIIAIISKYEKGFIEYIFDKDNLVGAFIVVYQGNSARYFKSAIDPERRDISIMHFGLFEAMKYCKEQGYLKFDLWGYNHFVDEKDQLYRVNLFKKGFAGDFTFFPKRMNFEFKPFSYKIFLFLKFIKDGIFNFWIKKY